jgi:hypothetical protein
LDWATINILIHIGQTMGVADIIQGEVLADLATEALECIQVHTAALEEDLEQVVILGRTAMARTSLEGDILELEASVILVGVTAVSVVSLCSNHFLLSLLSSQIAKTLRIARNRSHNKKFTNQS